MRDFFTSSLAVPVTVTLIASILATVIPLQQQASAFEIKDFKKLTLAFEKNVISGVWNPGDLRTYARTGRCLWLRCYALTTT